MFRRFSKNNQAAISYNNDVFKFIEDMMSDTSIASHDLQLLSDTIITTDNPINRIGNMNYKEHVSDVFCKALDAWYELRRDNAPLRITYKNIQSGDLHYVPKNAKYLFFSGNCIKEFMNIHEDVVELHISLNPLKKLGNLPPELVVLNISSTLLTVCPSLPLTLRSLRLANTEIQEIKFLPDGLQELIIAGTPIKRLPIRFPISLQSLDCAGCGIDTLPQLSPNLIILKAAYNNIEIIKEWPCEHLRYVDLHMNPFKGDIPLYVEEIHR